MVSVLSIPGTMPDYTGLSIGKVTRLNRIKGLTALLGRIWREKRPSMGEIGYSPPTLSPAAHGVCGGVFCGDEGIAVVA